MVTPNPNQPRLLADYAASPSPAERRAFKSWHRGQQSSLFADPATLAGCCPVCASPDHPEADCPHGTAGRLI